MADRPLRLLSAPEACDLLGIQPASLYAYVSRGLIRSVPRPQQRTRGYAAEDVERLLEKKSLRQAPEAAAFKTLDWGLPVLESGVSQIADGRLSYRGLSLDAALELSLEAVVGLLWQQPEHRTAVHGLPAAAELPLANLGAFEQLQLRLLWSGTQDLAAFDLSPAGVLASSGRILQLFFNQLSGSAADSLLGHFAGLDAPRRELLRVLLIVCADHELNASTFTARCVASARSTPYAAISAALAALEGRRHGGSTREAEALFSFCAGAPAGQGLRRWLQQHPTIPGCGHKLYPAGDPRWPAVAGVMERHFGDHPDWRLAQQLAAGLAELKLPPPNLDFALAAAGRIIAWPRTEALCWFALGRVIGWLAHIQEQYGQELLIRPRARSQASVAKP